MSLAGDMHRDEEMQRQLRTGELSVTSAINETLYRDPRLSIDDAIRHVDRLLEPSRVKIINVHGY